MARCVRALAIAVIPICLATGAVNAAQNARQIAKRTFPSVVLLVMEDAQGQALSQGSGFFVRPGIVVTNFHVIEGAASGFAKLIGKRTTYTVAGVVAVDQKRDLALLVLKGAKAPALKFGKTGTMAVGDTVFAVGNPLGLEGTFSQGIVSGVRHVGADTLLQVTAPISPGSSGGPILNVRGEVIGVAVASFTGGQNLNFAIPITYVERALAKMTVSRPLVHVAKRRKETALSFLYGGSVVKGVEVTHIQRVGYSAQISFSVRNKLRIPVKNITILFIFRDKNGNPVDTVRVSLTSVIPPHLAKRRRKLVDSTTLDISYCGKRCISKTSKYFVEARVLDFQFSR